MKSRPVSSLAGFILSVGFLFLAGPPLRAQPTNVLDSWAFADSTNWTSDFGVPPLSFAALGVSDLGNDTALVVDSTNAAWLQFNLVDSSRTNLALNHGTVLFWVAPDWTSTGQGGTGPRNWAPLIQAGDAFWGLYADPSGDNLCFLTQSNQAEVVDLSMPLAWTTWRWHQIAFTYSETNTCLYQDGELVTNGLGISSSDGELPPDSFFIGSSSNGVLQARSLLGNLSTYDYELDATNIARAFESYWMDYYGNPMNPANDVSPPSDGGVSTLDAGGGGRLHPMDGGVDGSGGGGGEPLLSYPANSMYLLPQGITNGIISLTITGTVAGTEYQILSKISLTNAAWAPEGLVVAAGNQTPVNVIIGARNTSLFLWARAYVASNPPTVLITSPANNSSFDTSRVNVSGNYTAASLQQITVNGVTAFINGTNFAALNVPLSPGANAIAAIAADIYGNTATNTITVAGVPGSGGILVDPVQLQATPVAGFAPLSVSFQVTANVPPTIQQVLYDFNGDGVSDQTNTDLSSIWYTYSSAGEYFPTVTIITSAGSFSSSGGWNSPDPNATRVIVQTPPVLQNVINITDPVDVRTTPAGYLYVLSQSTATITEYDGAGTMVRSLSGIGAAPNGLDVDGSGNVYVADTGDNQVLRFNPTNSTFQLDTTFGNAGRIGRSDKTSGSGNGEFNSPFDVAVSPDGTQISVSDSGNNRIQQFSTAGAFLISFGQQGSAVGQFSDPKGLTYDSAGYLYIVDSGNNRIALAPISSVAGVSGTYGSALGQFNAPVNISVGERGIYVADTGNDRIQGFDLLANGVYSFAASDIRFAVSLNFAQPSSAAVVENLTNEQFYVADTGNNRVVLCSLPGGDPTAAWANMTAQIAAGNIDGAATNFSSSLAQGYRQAFVSLGLAVAASDIGQIGPLTMVFIQDNTAEYYFEQTVAGHLLLFPVEFEKENGVWKISEF